jgi:methyl-accepting chemotaxis protein
MVDKTTTKDSDTAAASSKPAKDAGSLVLDGDAMDRFVRSFEASARRWELVVYPAMLAFVILAAYGFFLIYNLSRDIHVLAQGMDPDMAQHLTDISSSVAYLSENVRTMTRRVDKMSNTLIDISDKMDTMENLEPMLVHMRGMDASMHNMNITIDQMRGEVTYMGRSIGRPLSKMNSFFPW